jgi:hypothetical protein
MVATRLLSLVVVALLAASGCKDKGSEKNAEAASAKDDGAAKAAEDLLARRDALMKSRQKMQADREALEAERTKIIESGGDPTEIDRKLEEQRSEEQKIESEDAAIADQMSAFIESAKAISGDTQQQVAAREAAMANREKALASREDRVGQREASLASREKELAEREKNTCGAGGGTTIIQQVADPKGTKYSKRDVESALKKARESMSKRGILSSDLPAQAAGLEKEATKSMADGDYGPARFAAQQLLATVEAMKVDRNFISQKISRLSKKMSGRTLDEKVQKEVDDLFRDATAKYGDGDYMAANKKLNQIYRSID